MKYKKGEMVLVYNRKERNAKINSTLKIEDKHKFYQIKMKN
jgi:hypothetical protein